MNNLLSKIGLAGSTSIIVTEAVNLDMLWSALITLAISVCSCLAVDGVNWLRAKFREKTKESEKGGD